MPTPPSYRKVNPADSSDPHARAHVATRCRSRRQRVRRDDHRAAALDGQRRGAGARVRRAEVRRARAARSRSRSPRAASARRGASGDRNANVNLPTGMLSRARRATFTSRRPASSRTPTAFRQLIVAYRNGAPVRLGELGRVIDDVQNNKIAALVQRTRAVDRASPCQRQPGTNTVEVADASQGDASRRSQAQLPPSVELDVLYDRVAVDPRVGRRRAVHAAAHARARRAA